MDVVPGDSVMRSPSPAVVIPDDAGRTVAERRALAELPVGEVAGNLQERRDEVMREVQELQDHTEAAATPNGGEALNEDDNNDDDDDLFGDDQHASDDDQDEKPAIDTAVPSKEVSPDDAIAAAEAQSLTEAELERRRRLEYEEDDDDEAPPVVEQKVQYAAVKLARLPMASDKAKLWHAKLPNFLHLEARPFTSDTYDPEIEPATVPVENTIRWRWSPSKPSTSSNNGQDATPVRQSNSRIVRWNDGSLSLQIGKEIFDIATDRTATGKAVPPASTVAPLVGQQSESGQSTTYLVAQHGYAGLLESQAVVGGSMAFRLTSINAAHAGHRKLARAQAAKEAAFTGGKKGKTVMVMADKDPDAEKLALEAGLKKRRPRAAKGEGVGAGGRKGKRKSVRSQRLGDEDWSDEDAEDDDAGTGLEGGEEAVQRRVLAAERKRRREREQAEMDDFLATDSEDNDASGGDDDDGDTGRSPKKSGRSRAAQEERDAAEDEFDALEARAEKVRRADKDRKKNKAGGPSAPFATKDLDSDDVDNDEPAEFTKKKLVVESDDDE